MPNCLDLPGMMFWFVGFMVRLLFDTFVVH